MKRRTKRKIYALVALVIFLGGLEVGSRVLQSSHPDWFTLTYGESYMFPDEKLLWKMLSGDYIENGVKVHINSIGMRGPELSPQKPEGTYRLLFLGDSSVYGDGVPEQNAFPFDVGKILQKSWGRPVEIANGSLPGYSSTQSRILFEMYVDRINPDAVVIATIWSDYIGRQLTDKELYEKFSTLGFRFSDSSRKFFRASSFFQLLEVWVESKKPFPESHIIDWNSVIRGNHGLNKPRVSMEDHVKNMVSICKQCFARDIDPYLLILPYNQDMMGQVPSIIKGYRENFSTVGRQFGIVPVDMPSFFSKYSPSRDPEFFIDGLHPSSRGHHIIAEKIAEKILEKEKIIPDLKEK